MAVIFLTNLIREPSIVKPNKTFSNNAEIYVFIQTVNGAKCFSNRNKVLSNLVVYLLVLQTCTLKAQVDCKFSITKLLMHKDILNTKKLYLNKTVLYIQTKIHLPTQY